MYFPDLSIGIARIPGYIVLNVGWLEKGQPYSEGNSPEDFKSKLFQLCLHSMMRTRGYHTCEFCKSPGKGPLPVQRDGVATYLGTAEAWAIYRNKIYTAPNLIYHYVTEHNYAPPEEFVEAVLYGVGPESDIYKKLAARFAG